MLSQIPSARSALFSRVGYLNLIGVNNFSKECQKRCSETNFDLQTAGTATVLGAGYFGMSVELSSQSTRISENTNYIDDTCTRVSVTYLS